MSSNQAGDALPRLSQNSGVAVKLAASNRQLGRWTMLTILVWGLSALTAVIFLAFYSYWIAPRLSILAMGLDSTTVEAMTWKHNDAINWLRIGKLFTGLVVAGLILQVVAAICSMLLLRASRRVVLRHVNGT